MNWQWHPALEEPLDRSISWFGSLSAEWSRIRILDDRLLLRISVQVPDGPVDLALEISNWRLNRSNWATVGNKDPIGGLPFLTVVSRKMLQTKLQWPVNAMLHFVRSYSTDLAFLMLFGNCALVDILIREGVKKLRHGNFPWREGGVPPFSVNFFPLGFREPTVRGGGRGGTPPFR